jgi:hypothetical protein
VGDLLRFAVLEDFEVSRSQVGNLVALFVGDHGIDLDQVHGDAQGRRFGFLRKRRAKKREHCDKTAYLPHNTSGFGYFRINNL